MALGLGPHFGVERIGLRVDRAGQREILPDHHAFAVAEIEEALSLVDVAAPTADHVAVEIAEQRQRIVKPRVVAAVQRIKRDPIGALAEDVDAVDDKLELTVAVGRHHLGIAQRDGAEAEGAPPVGDDPALFDQRKLDVIERRPAIALGIPEVDIGDRLVDLAFGGEDDVVRFVRQLAGGAIEDAETQVAARHERIRRFGEAPVHQQPGAALGRVDAQRGEIDVVEADRGPVFDAHVLPQARRHDSRHDVPAIHAGRLADADRFPVVLVGVRPRIDRQLAALENGGVDGHGEGVLALAQQAVERELVGDQHVGGGAETLTVEPDRGERIDAVEDQHRPARPRRRSEGVAIPPLMRLVGAQQIDVVGVVEVGGQSARRDQVELDIARNGSGYCGEAGGCFRFGKRIGARRLPSKRQLPGSIEADMAARIAVSDGCVQIPSSHTALWRLNLLRA